jgi:catechol 2,3-dioxygenase-like lactoylglutathione lyase family enzyme
VIDHVILGVSDVAASRAFYERALAPLGIGVILEHPLSGIGFGRDGMPFLWIAERVPSAPVHVAFAAADPAAVDAFHAEALTVGGRDNGQPGLRPQYHRAYYGAFVLDPDGNNIEAVCHERRLTAVEPPPIIPR